MVAKVREVKPSDFWVVEDVARFLNITKQGVRKALLEGRLKGRNLGKQWIIYEKDLRNYMRK